MTVSSIAPTAPIDVVLARLAKVAPAGKRRWSAECPVHEGNDQALTVTVSRDGRVTLACGDGCSPPAIAGAIGLEVSDLYPPAPTTNGSAPAAIRITSTPAPANDRRLRIMASEEAEQAVIAAALIDSHAIEHALPVVDWQMFFADRHRLLFKAMTLLAETDVVIDPVTLSETLSRLGDLERAGGKDYIGFLVDAVPTSANIVYHAGIVRDWSRRRRLLGTMEATATVIRDGGNDALDVAEIARQVATELAPLTEDARAGLPFAVCALDAPEPEPITWCVEELLIAGELAVFAGDGGSFKSTAAFHVAAAVAGGYAAFGRFPTTRAPVLLLSAEDGEGVIRNRLEALIVGHAWDRERVLSNVHILASHDAKLSSPEWQDRLLAEATRLKIGFMAADPLFDLVEGDENSNTDLRPVIKFCRKIARETGAAVTIVHHAAKVKEGQRQIDRVRGATALRDAARCVLFFEDQAAGVSIEHLKMSRSEKLLPFMLTREIESSADSRAVWVSARFTYQSTDEAVLSRAETFVLDQVTAFPGALKSGDLRGRGKADGIRGEDLAKALTHLQARGLLDYASGPKGAKFWTPVHPSGAPLAPPSVPARVTLGRQTPIGEIGLFRDSGEPAPQLPQPAHPAQSRSGSLPSAQNQSDAPIQPARPVGTAGRLDGSEVGGQAGRQADPADDDELDVVDIPEEHDL